MGLRDPKLCFWRWRDGQSRNHFVSLGQAPKHQFALWYRDDFNDSVGAGLGVVRKSRQFAATRTSATATRLLALTCINAALFFTANERLELQVNVENLLDKAYFSDSHNNNNITPGAPINARFTARMKF